MASHLIYINSTDITDYVKTYSVTIYARNKIGEAELTLRSDAGDFEVGDEVKIYRNLITDITDADILFRGYITKYEKKLGLIKINAQDKMVKCKERLVNRVYLNTDDEGGVISEIFKDIVETYAGLTADVYDTSTGYPTLKQYRCIHSECLERMTELASVISFQFYYKPYEDVIRFEPEGYQTNTTTLTTGINVLGKVIWEYDKSELINKITLIGGEQLVETTEYFSGTGSLKEYQLTHKPKSIKVYVNNVLKKIGVEGTGTYDGYVDYDRKILKINAPSGTDNIKVDYSYINPIITIMLDEDSISEYGLCEKVITYSDVKTLDDLESRGQIILDAYSEPFKSATLKIECVKTQDYGLKAGQKVYFEDTQNNITGYFVIQKIKYNYPPKYDEITIGDKEARLENINFDMLKRLKRLEEQSVGDLELAYQYVNITNTRKLLVSTKQYYNFICDTFIIGNERHGIIGTSAVLDDLDASSTNWTGSGTISDETTIYKRGAGSLKMTATSGSNYLITTANKGDLSKYTMTNSGNPSDGLIGLYIYTTKTLSNVKLRIGSDSSNYTEVEGELFWQSVGYSSVGQQSGWNYYVFDLTAGTTTGTPDWTSVSYIYISFDIDDNDSVYFDNLTITSNDYAPCCLDDGRIEIEVV